MTPESASGAQSPASTGPRSGERGRHRAHVAEQRRFSGFNGAALWRARKGGKVAAANPALELQRGRALESAEGRKQSTLQRKSSPRFNGAALWRARKGRARHCASNLD